MSDFLKRLREQSRKPDVPTFESPAAAASPTVRDRMEPAAEPAPVGANTPSSGGLRLSWKSPSVPAGVTQPAPAEVSAPTPVDTPSPDSHELVVQESQPKGEQPTGPAGFQEKLNRYDAIVGKLTSIDPIMHAVVKGHVKAIMVDLNSSPEMRELIIDRDVHNIMLFVQASTASADKHFEQVATKRIKKEANAKSENKANIGSALDDLLLSFGAPKPKDVNAVATLNTDAIKPKTR